MNIRIVCLGIATLLLGACATAPKPLQGQFHPVSPQNSVTTNQVGALVRWGGRIIETSPGPDRTCFQILSRPLTSSGRPASSTSTDTTDGRFIACRAGFYDPAVFERGREVTFIGRINDFQNTRIGEYEYRLPKLDADVIYLWPVVREVEVRAVPMYDPFWGPWGPWGPWGSPYRGWRGW